MTNFWISQFSFFCPAPLENSPPRTSLTWTWYSANACENIAIIANAVQCYFFLSGQYDCLKGHKCLGLPYSLSSLSLGHWLNWVSWFSWRSWMSWMWFGWVWVSWNELGEVVELIWDNWVSLGELGEQDGLGEIWIFLVRSFLLTILITCLKSQGLPWRLFLSLSLVFCSGQLMIWLFKPTKLCEIFWK